MITRIDVNHFNTVACNLVQVALADNDALLSDVDQSLKFAKEFIREKIADIQTKPVSLASMEKGRDEMMYRTELGSSLATLDRAIEQVLGSSKDQKQVQIMQLLKYTRDIEAEADEFRLCISSRYPEIPGKRPSCPGFKGPVEVLHAIKEENKQKRTRTGN